MTGQMIRFATGMFPQNLLPVVDTTIYSYTHLAFNTILLN